MNHEHGGHVENPPELGVNLYAVDKSGKPINEGQSEDSDT